MNSFTFNVETKDRLDIVLTSYLPDFSRSRLQRLITEGEVKLNGQVCSTKKTLLQPGDHLEINIPPTKELSDVEAEAIPLDILYEDEYLLIINKPAGLVVHPSPGHPDGTLVNALLAHCQDLVGIGGVGRPGIVHRLDKDTTGAIMVAKTDFAHQHLQRQLREKTARRDYLGVAYGAPRTPTGTVNLPIARHPIDRKKMAVVPDGREAVTHWEVKERLGIYSLIYYRLETGRTHQIRVHTSHMGHPLVGDTLYGAGRSIGVNLPGQALHAWKLSLEHPQTGEPLTVTAPRPETFTKLLTLLRLRTIS